LRRDKKEETKEPSPDTRIIFPKAIQTLIDEGRGEDSRRTMQEERSKPFQGDFFKLKPLTSKPQKQARPNEEDEETINPRRRYRDYEDDDEDEGDKWSREDEITLKRIEEYKRQLYRLESKITPEGYLDKNNETKKQMAELRGEIRNLQSKLGDGTLHLTRKIDRRLAKYMPADQRVGMALSEVRRGRMQAEQEVMNLEMKDFIDIESLLNEVDNYEGIQTKYAIMKRMNQAYYEFQRDKASKVSNTVNGPEPGAFRLTVNGQRLSGISEIYIAKVIVGSKTADAALAFGGDWRTLTADQQAQVERDHLVIAPKFAYRRRIAGKDKFQFTLSIQNWWPTLKKMLEYQTIKFWILYRIFKDREMTQPVAQADIRIIETSYEGVTPGDVSKQWLSRKGALALAISSWKYSRELALKKKMNKLKYNNINILKKVKGFAT
jgi:hypothetical protein